MVVSGRSSAVCSAVRSEACRPFSLQDLDVLDLSSLDDGMQILRDVFREFHPGFSPEDSAQDYVVFDLETSDADPRSGRIWQVGLYFPHSCVRHTLNLAVGADVLRTCRYEIARRAGLRAAAGLTFSDQEVADEFVAEVEADSHPPDTVLHMLRAALLGAPWVVGHNTIRFDLPIMYNEMARFCVPSFTLKNIIDTAMLVKAAVAPAPLLEDTKSAISYYAMVAGLRTYGIKFSIAHCVQTFGMDRLGFDLAKAHGAGYDCWLSGTLLRAIHKRVKEYP